jgi:hypothetical protein
MFGVKEESLPYAAPSFGEEKKVFFGVEVEDPQPLRGGHHAADPFADEEPTFSSRRAAPSVKSKLAIPLAVALAATLVVAIIKTSDANSEREATKAAKAQLVDMKARVDSLTENLNQAETKSKGLEAEKTKLTQQLQAKTNDYDELVKKTKGHGKKAAKPAPAHHTKVSLR